MAGMPLRGDVVVDAVCWFLATVEGGREEGGISVESLPVRVTLFKHELDAKRRCRSVIGLQFDRGKALQVHQGAVPMVWGQVICGQKI